jgi:hypothetical protein
MPTTLAALECCPPLDPDTTCDVVDFRYVLTHRVPSEERGEVAVEVTLRYRLERCPGPLTLGDLAYSTTLLPGEKVRLFTTDRRTRFTFDSATNLSHRSEQTSEEQFYMASMSDFMSDLSVVDRVTSTNTATGSTSGHAETNGAISAFLSGPSVDVSGSFSARTTHDFAHSLRQHAVSSDRRSVQGARAASSVSIGEVSTRSHAEGTSEDHFESSSREFSNPNRCHAITFLFYRINKTQTVRFTLESIERRVLDPAAPTKVVNNEFLARGGVSTIPDPILATRGDRLDVERIGRESVQLEREAVKGGEPELRVSGLTAARRLLAAAPLTLDAMDAALQQVERDLVDEGLLDKVGGDVSEETRSSLSFEETSSLPTAGVIVKGCLDECSICEPDLERENELRLEMLARQIELLDKSQEYRCCPHHHDEDDHDHGHKDKDDKDKDDKDKGGGGKGGHG